MVFVIFFIFLILILPLVFTLYFYFDLQDKRLYFAVFLFGKIKLLCGYFKPRNNESFYLHLSNNKTIIIDISVLKKLKGGRGFLKSFDISYLNFIVDAGVCDGILLFTLFSLKKLSDYFFITFNFTNILTEINVFNKDKGVISIKCKLIFVFNIVCILKTFIANNIFEVKNVKKKINKLKRRYSW